MIFHCLRHFALLLFWLAPAGVCCAHSLWWNSAWITHPSASAGEQVLFSRMYTAMGDVSRATLSVAATGRYQLYVNGYNVTTAVMEPGTAGMSCGSTEGVAVDVVTYEVARFLSADTNVVALWCSPDATGRCLASVSFCGYDGVAPVFSYSSDSSWLCGVSGGSVSSFFDHDVAGSIYVREQYDSRLYNTCWSGYEYETWRWVGASALSTASVVGPASASLQYVLRPLTGEYRTVEKIYDGMLSHKGRKSFLFRFDDNFSGWVRLTLRNMHRGDTVFVNGFKYICSGETDEQLCRRFTESYQRLAFIEGRQLKEESITNVEGICIGSRSVPVWGY